MSNTIKSSRVGLISTKIGMSSVFRSDGSIVPVTLLKVENNVVLNIKKNGNDDSVAVLMGSISTKNVKKSVNGLAKKINAGPFAFSKEFIIDKENIPNIGDVISSSHFIKGQFIDVTSRSIGKGFAGSMKRWNFSGLEASHGVSASHRSHGSTGQRQDPGKVFKGKKMAGHLGCKKVTVQNLKIIDIDTELSVIAVLGAIPGGTNANIVLVRDAKKKIYYST